MYQVHLDIMDSQAQQDGTVMDSQVLLDSLNTPGHQGNQAEDVLEYLCQDGQQHVMFKYIRLIREDSWCNTCHPESLKLLSRKQLI